MRFVLVIFLSLTALSAVSFANPLEEKNDEGQEVSLSDVLAMVLKDPEYLSMSDYEQYMVLMSLYTAVKNVIHERKGNKVIANEDYKRSLSERLNSNRINF